MGTLNIYGSDSITMTNAQGRTLPGFSWDGTTLRHPGGANFTPTPEFAARIDAAIAEVVPARTESLTGAKLSALPEAERQGFEFSHIRDVHGVYVRHTPGHFPAPITYIPADMGR